MYSTLDVLYPLQMKNVQYQLPFHVCFEFVEALGEKLVYTDKTIFREVRQ